MKTKLITNVFIYIYGIIYIINMFILTCTCCFYFGPCRNTWREGFMKYTAASHQRATKMFYNETTPGQQVVGSDYTNNDMFRATGPSATWILYLKYFLPLTSERQYSYRNPQAQVLVRITQTKVINI